MDRTQKEGIVDALKNSFRNSFAVVVTQQKGLKVSESTHLRREVRGVQAEYKVVKNNLVRLAIKDTKHDVLSSYLKGPTALAFCADPVSLAKAVVEFSEKNANLVVIGGMIGETLLGPDEVNALAKLPSLGVVRGQLLGLLVAPATKIARILKEPASLLARVTQARSCC